MRNIFFVKGSVRLYLNVAGPSEYITEWIGPIHFPDHIPVNTKHFYNICTMLDRRRRRGADVVQMW